MNEICGQYPARTIKLDGVELCPGKSQQAFNHSPDGFNWGYGGSGPAQLALALLLEVVDVPTAVSLHQTFKTEVVSQLPQGRDFMLRIDLAGWVKEKLKQRGAHG
jgi:hypothetical protein